MARNSTKRFAEFRATRSALWLLSQDKANCVAFAVALLLNAEYAECLRFVDDNLLCEAANANKGYKAAQSKLNLTDEVELDQLYLLKARLLTKRAQ